MQGYLGKIRQLQSSFEFFSIKQVPRRKNSHVNLLAILATFMGQGLPRVIIVEDLVTPSCHDQATVGIHNMQVGQNWMDPMVLLLKDITLLEGKIKVEKI